MVNVIVPTLNAAKDWALFAPALLACVRPEQVLIVDSESTDGTSELAHADGFQVCTIKRAEFNHGGTRQMAVNLLPSADVLVFLTQDAVLTDPNAIENIVAAFDDLMVGAAYGRQLPRLQSGAIEAHARSFNYPALSDLRDLASREKLGFKAIFLSNSFSAYRRSALMGIGGFPLDVIFGEDTITAARLLQAKYKIAYVADACVYHSHPHTWKQEFNRYFDIGVLHSRESWLLNEFGKTSGEGTRFALSELRYLLQRDPAQIPSSLFRTGLKFLGYKLGLKEALFSPAIKRRLSMNHRFWQ
ncbi:glycosyltransferase [Terracidiphilus sp.]|jgi:rhamnosyltransferase|uniref:glycosyltransferase n=1 Tax=Terracidiphilus sp. TaxID=1964191 RepID=UPI003C20AC8E